MRNILKRIVIGLAFMAAIIVAPTTPANAASGFLICTTNGHGYCIDSPSPLAGGNGIFQNYSFNARALTTPPTGDSCPIEPGYSDCFQVTIQFYNGDYMASVDSCNGNVTVHTTDTTGTVWYFNEDKPGPNFLLRNRNCINTSGGSYLYADNVLGNHYHLDGGGTSGNLYRMQLVNP